MLKEAVVNLANPKKSYGRRAYSSRSSIKNPLTGKKFEETYEIADYLNQKYKAQIEANGGKKPAAYQKEYQDLYNAVFGAKNTSTSKSTSSTSPAEDDSTVTGGISKEEGAVLKRIENFVKYFVYKIDDGRNTNKVRKYFMDMLKTKVTAHKEPVNTKPANATTATPATPAATPKTTKSTPKKGGVGKLKESIVRNEIRNIFKDLL